MASLRLAIWATLATLLLGEFAPTFGQTGEARPLTARRSADLAVEAFDIEQVPQLTAGTHLNFSLYGTPGAAVTLQIDGAPKPLELNEVGAGMYEGSYRIEAQDRIDPQSRVTATMRRNGRALRAVLEEPLLLGAAAPIAGRSMMPRSTPDDRVLAAPRARAGMPVPRLPAPAPCTHCAVVESVRVIELDDGPARVGAVAGDVAGAIFGEGIGQAHARHVQWVLATLGGALTGREFERPGEPRVRYEAVLRMPSGMAEVRRFDSEPPFRVGDTIPLAPVTAPDPQRSAPPF